MPIKIAEKKLILPTLLIIVMLSALAIIPILRHEEAVFVSIDHDCLSSFPLGDGYSVVYFGGVDIYSSKGNLVLSDRFSGELEHCASNGKLFAASIGKMVRIYSPEGFQGEIQKSGDIVSLAVTENYIISSSLCPDYASCVTVYSGTVPLFERFVVAGKCTSIAEADENIFLALDCGISSQLLVLDGVGNEVARLDLSQKIKALHQLDNAVAAEFDGKVCFYGSDGALLGEYSGRFSALRAFDDVLCAKVPGGAIALNVRGETLGKAETPGNVPIFFGQGKYPALIMGETVTVFNKKMDNKYSIVNSYVPSSVITYKEGAVLFWQRAAEIHRK